MSLDGFNVATVVAIVVICYLVGIICKNTIRIEDKVIPVVMGICGAVLGVVGFYAMPDFPATDILNAIAVGIVSGLSATGVNQIYKQATKAESVESAEVDQDEAEKAEG